MNYLIASLICVLSMIVGIIGLNENEQFSIRRKKQFVILAAIIILEILLDTITILIDGNDIDTFKIFKIAEFIITPFIPMMFTKIIANRRFWNKIKKYFVILVTTNTVMQSVTLFLPVAFTFDSNSMYSRTVFTHVYLGIVIIAFMLFLYATSNTFIQNINKHSITLYLVNVLVLLGLLLRGTNNQSNADWLAITMGYFIFTIYFSNEYLKIDRLTSLLSQRIFHNSLTRINYNTAIIVIDANKFKHINDTYGHQTGDWALKKISEAIISVYGEIGYCFRIGGDEFAVVLREGILDNLALNGKNCNIYNILNGFKTSLEHKLQEMSKEQPILKYGVAQGYSIFYNNTSIDTYKSINQVLQDADINMYSNKKKQFQNIPPKVSSTI